MYKDYLKLIPKRIDKETKEFIDEVVFNESRYLFIRKEGKKEIGYCTSCKKEYEVYEKHNDFIYCKKCGKRVQVKLTRYGRKYMVNARTVLVFQKALKGFNGIVGRGFYVERDYSGDYKRVNTVYTEVALYIFGEDKSIMYNKQNYWGWNREENNFNDERRKTFYKTGSIFNFNINSLANVPFYIDRDSLDRAVENTSLKYAIYKNINNDSILKYLNLYIKYPIIESLQKMGITSIVGYMVSGKSLERQVNWRGKTVFDFLKLNRGQVKELINSNVYITPRLLELYRENYRKSYKLSVQELKDIENMSAYYRAHKILYYVNIKQLYRYVIKQYKLHDKEYVSYSGVIVTWLDYIDDLKELKIDINKNLFPRDLFTKHLALQEQIKYIADKRLNGLINLNKKTRDKMKFDYKGLKIRAAVTAEEIIEEGKILKHCVGGYVESYAKGITNILFIRKIDDKDTPYYTVEINNEFKIVQVRGKSNIRATKEIDEFIKMYKRVVLNKLKTEKLKIKVA